MSPLKILLTTGALALFVALGVWQLDRAQEKEAVRDRVLARAQMPVVDVGAAGVAADDLLYRQARARGAYVPEYQVFLDNKVHRGRAGYHVLTPLRIEGSDVLLLVNRGWAPWGPDRQRAPVAEPPGGEVTVSGRLSRPVRAPITLGADGPEGLARVWQNFDLERYRSLAGAPVLPLVMELQGGSAMSDLVREWPAYDDAWIGRHQAYAAQWFAIAAVLLVAFVFAHRKKSKKR